MYNKRYPTTTNNLLGVISGSNISDPANYHLHVRKLVEQITTMARHHAGASVFEINIDEILARPKFSARFRLHSNVGTGEQIRYSLLNKNQVNLVGHKDEATGEDKCLDLDFALSEFVLAVMIDKFHREACNCLMPKAESDEGKTSAPVVPAINFDPHGQRPVSSGNWPI